MPLTTQPTKSDLSIGRIKSDIGVAPNLDNYVPAAEFEIIKDYIIDMADEIGNHIGAAGSLNTKINIGPLLLADGSIPAPAYAFSGDPGMGVVRQNPFWAVVDNGFPMLALRQSIDATGNGEGATFLVDINQPGTPGFGWTALKINVTTTADTGIGNKYIIQANLPGGDVFQVLSGPTLNGTVRVVGGTEANPCYSRITQADAGMSFPGTSVSLSFGGVGVLRVRTGAVEVVPTGTASAPSIYWNGDTDNGFYAPNANQVGVTCGNSNIMRWGNAQVFLGSNGSVTLPVIARLTDADTGLFFPTGDTFAVAAGSAEPMRWTSTQALILDGTLTAPGIAFTSTPGTGMYLSSNLRFAHLGAETVRMSSAFAQFAAQVRAASGSAGVPAFATSAATNTGMYFPANDRIGFSTTGVLGLSLSQALVAATGDETALDATITVNKATSGNYTALKINVTETSAPGADDRLMDLQTGGTSRFRVGNTGIVSIPSGLLNAPQLVAIGDEDTGLAWDGAGQMSMVSNGAQRFRMETTQCSVVPVGTSALPALEVGNNSNVGLWNPATNQLGLQANAESLIVDNDSAVPSFRPDVDNTWSLGESALRFTTLYSVALDTGDINMHGNDGAWWTLVESHDGIFALNRKNGKRYAVQLRELRDDEVTPQPVDQLKAA